MKMPPPTRHCSQKPPRPVRVQWSRADEHGWDPKGPPTLIDLRANVDVRETLLAWESQFFIPQGAAGNVDLLSRRHLATSHSNVSCRQGYPARFSDPYKFPNIKNGLPSP